MAAAGLLERVLAWVWRMSWQASVLVLLVLLTQWLFHARLTPRWRYALWWLVLVRLLLPVAPGTPFSIFNVVNRRAPAPHAALIHGALPRTDRLSPPSLPEALPATPPESAPATAHTLADQTVPAMPPGASPSSAPAAPESAVPLILWGLAGTWGVGITLMLSRLIWGNLGFARRLRRRGPLADPALLEVLDECRRVVGVSQPRAVIETPEVDSPALFGCFRVKLLLPPRMAGTFSRAELRHVFLHELAHIRRWDVPTNWLMTLLQIVHWFNPVIWLASSRMRADRELACDALALSLIQDDESQPYGRTIIKFLEGFVRPAAVPGLVGILEEKAQMKRRIRMIAEFKQTTHRPLLATAILAVLTLIALTDAQNKPESDKPVSVTPPVTGPGATEKAPPRGESDTVVDPKTGVKAVLAKTISGTNNVIEHLNKLTLSPDGRFLLWWGRVVPLDGTEAFRSGAGPQVAVSPNGRYVAHGGDDAVWVQPVSSETLRPDGPAKKLLDLKGEQLAEAEMCRRPEAIHWTGDSETVYFWIWGPTGKASQHAFSPATGARVNFPDNAARGLRSPDGMCVAFTDENPGFWVQTLGEGAARNLCNEGAAPLCWSEDGRWLIGIGRDKGVVRFTQYPDGQEYLVSLPSELKSSSACVGTSPDKKMLLFYQPGHELKLRVKVALAANGALKDVDGKAPYVHVTNFQWAPDGKTILIVACTAQRECGLFASPLSGEEPVQFAVKPHFHQTHEPSPVSPDGKWLLSREGSTRVFDLGVLSLSPANREATAPATVVFRNAHYSADMRISVWSPDSTRVALTSKDDSGDGEGIWIAFTDGKAPLRFTRTTARERDLKWSPDGSMLAFVSDSAGTGELKVVPTAGGETTVIRKWADANEPAWGWSPDSKSLTIAEGNMLVQQPLSGGEAKSIASLKESGIEWAYRLSWSPDGSRLALTCDKPRNKDLRVWGQLLFARVEEGRLLRTAAVDLKGGSWNYAWSPDSEHVAYICEDAVTVRPDGRLYALAVADILERISAGAIPLNRKQTATPAVEKPSTEVDPVSQAEPIVGPVFSDNFDDGPSKYWRILDSSREMLPPAGHATVNGELMLSNSSIRLDQIDWTDYVVTVRVCMKEAAASGEGVFGILTRTTPCNFGIKNWDRYHLAITCQDGLPTGLYLGTSYFDASKTGQQDLLDWRGCTIVPDKWYTLGFEVRGQHLRGFLDGKLMVEATDERLSKGGIWLSAWRTKALFDDFSARQLP